MEEEEIPPVETPPTVKMPRAKNPNNVKAGKASAEKRRQKEEEFLDVKQRLALLEEHKEKLRRLKDISDDELSARQQEEIPAGPQTVTKEPPRGTLHTPWDLWGGDWTPWIFGGLGLAVVGYISLRGRLQDISLRGRLQDTTRGKPQAKSVKPQSVPGVPPAAAAKPQPPTASDPFFME